MRTCRVVIVTYRFFMAYRECFAMQIQSFEPFYLQEIIKDLLRQVTPAWPQLRRRALWGEAKRNGSTGLITLVRNLQKQVWDNNMSSHCCQSSAHRGHIFGKTGKYQSRGRIALEQWLTRLCGLSSSTSFLDSTMGKCHASLNSTACSLIISFIQ